MDVVTEKTPFITSPTPLGDDQDEIDLASSSPESPSTTRTSDLLLLKYVKQQVSSMRSGLKGQNLQDLRASAISRDGLRHLLRACFNSICRILHVLKPACHKSSNEVVSSTAFLDGLRGVASFVVFISTMLTFGLTRQPPGFQTETMTGIA